MEGYTFRELGMNTFLANLGMFMTHAASPLVSTRFGS